MLQLTAKHKIFIGINPIDFRSGIDAIAGYCKSVLSLNPFNGHVFLFRSRRANAIRILLYDSQGFWLSTKRLSQGTFKWWPKTTEQVLELSISQLNSILWNDKPPPLPTEPWREI
ncbi:MAG: IS66 family insertion sequence element accessory protein TnpB [Methanobacteriaceae archaeon]